MIEFPESITYGDLCKTHSDYNPTCALTKVGLLDKHRDLYEGGARFRKNIKNYLVARQLESGGSNMTAFQPPPGDNPNDPTTMQVPDMQHIPQTPYQPAGMNAQYDRRARRSAYAPIGSGMIDFMKAAIFQEEPSLLVTGDDARAKYWNQLNIDCDGKGQTIDSMLQEAELGVFLDFRSYLLITDPGVKDETGATQKLRGELDSRICYLSARDVDDWSFNEYGNLEWVRVRRFQVVRSKPWLQPDTNVRTWIYVTKEKIFEYEKTWLVKDPAPKAEDLVARKSASPHGMTYQSVPCMPVVPIQIQPGLWLMDRLSDIILSLFNRQSAATWSLDQMAFAILAIFTNQDLGTLLVPDISGMKLMPGDGAEFKAPDVAIHTAQLADIERLTGELSLVIQTMVLVAAAKDDQGRKSGISKKLDFSALTTLLSAYASPLRKALERVVQIIQEHRDDTDISITVEGLKNFSVQSIESMLANATLALALPKELPETAQRWILRGVALKATEDAPDATRKKVIEQAKTMELKAPAPPPMQESFHGPIRNPTKEADANQGSIKTKTAGFGAKVESRSTHHILHPNGNGLNAKQEALRQHRIELGIEDDE